MDDITYMNGMPTFGWDHGLRTPNEGVNRRNLKNWADVADKIMLWPYLKIWNWDLVFGRAVKAISSLGVRSPWVHRCIQIPLSFALNLKKCCVSWWKMFRSLKKYSHLAISHAECFAARNDTKHTESFVYLSCAYIMKQKRWRKQGQFSKISLKSR